MIAGEMMEGPLQTCTSPSAPSVDQRMWTSENMTKPDMIPDLEEILSLLSKSGNRTIMDSLIFYPNSSLD